MKKPVVFASALFVGFVCGLVVAGRLSLTELSPAAPRPTQTRPAPAPIPAALPDLSPVAERAIRASVNISSTRYYQLNPWFQRYYGTDAVRPETSLGSGVIVTDDGYVLTNSHVIGNAAAEIKVTLPDKRELSAKLIGSDTVSDLALVKVNATGLAPLPWGDSSKLRVAEWVLAVGNPFQFSQTVTLGIVSAVNRREPQLASYADMIQTDAAINPGNSGGALVNSRGELIGINTMIISETGGYQGLGFAIPANLARQVMEELKRSGVIARGTIGLTDLVNVDPADAERAGLGRVAGVLIYNMYRRSPADQAGLQVQDLIIRVNGQTVSDAGQVERLILDAKVGSTLKIEVLRDGRHVSVDVPVAQLKATPPRL
jgi:serine protease Do